MAKTIKWEKDFERALTRSRAGEQNGHAGFF